MTMVHFEDNTTPLGTNMAYCQARSVPCAQHAWIYCAGSQLNYARNTLCIGNHEHFSLQQLTLKMSGQHCGVSDGSCRQQQLAVGQASGGQWAGIYGGKVMAGAVPAFN